MSEYLQPTPLSWIGKQLREKTNRGERYTMEDAVQSYLLDQLRGIDRDKSSYARMWNWGRTTVYRHLDEIEERAEEQRTFYRSSLKPGHGGTRGGTDAEQTRNTRRNTKRPSEPAKAENRTPAETDVKQQRDSDETPYISDYQTKTKKCEGESAPAREAGEDSPVENPQPSFESADEVYRNVTGHENPGVYAVDLMRQIVDEGKAKGGGNLPGAPAERRGLFAEVCQTWTDSDTRNERQPMKLLSDFQQQLTEIYGHGKRNGSRQPGQDPKQDPAGTYERFSQAAAGAFDPPD